ncbi:hypothetical protein FDJ25_gp018 [Vibrio phage Aphrodite1]|uniref:Uncharacterized protein n=1 Tax=Vibrio phage Aphrodite1 TaxID=2070057 RepID=A0A2I7QI36_9CAUD|nr:hypothetical protein FDJ25_gp018 [Vibrio phage Aphrodite1]AUR81057.1 hypothetical protein Aphrodite1_0192 [Vibrio phage Aphrodite1]
MSKETQPNYSDLQKSLIENLKKNHNYDKATNVVVFDADKLEMPEGVTGETIQNHVNYFNQLSGAVEATNAEITRDLYGKNEEHVNTEGTLSLPGLTFNTQHNLQMEVGDDKLYGVSTTITDFQHTEEASDWLAAQRESNESLARKLFS